MTRLDQLLRTGLAVVAAGSLALTGCSATKDAATGVGDAAKDAATGVGDVAKDAASGVGQAAKDAATATGQAALTPAVAPVLDLLKKGEGEVKAGNLAAAAATMGGFQGLWDKAGPVIQPLAGDKWGAIDTAAKALISTFGGGQPDATAAGSAITGLMGPLSALIGK
ncbi:MAG: hypothetical protein ACK5E6_10015 [Cyanobacteriota bacterium]